MKRKVDNWIKGFLDYNFNNEAPRAFIEWTAISVIAAVLQRKAFLQWGYLTFYPNLYVVLVGPSGVRKGTAMTEGSKFLRELGIKMAAEATTREALIQQLRMASESEVDLLTGQVDLHASLTVYAQELVVFLGHNNMQLLSDLTDWYDCRDIWTYRTKTQGSDDIFGVWVNLIGATTPQIIQNALPRDAIGGGLTSRMIFVYAAQKEKRVSFPFLTAEAMKLRDDLAYDLDLIKGMRGMFQPTESFLRKWDEWYMGQDTKPPFQGNPNLEGYVERRGNHILKLSLIMSAATTDSMELSGEHLDMAIDLLGRTEAGMEHVFAGYGAARSSDAMSRMITFIKGAGKVDEKYLFKVFYADFDSPKHLEDAFSQLERAGLIKRYMNTGMVQYTGPA